MNVSRYAQVEVTTICNFDCFYCAGRDMEQRHMAMPVFARVMAQLPAFSRMTVSLQGEGEPTLHPAFWDMARAVRSKGLQTYTITNGTRVDASQFAKELHSVGVSVDTVDADEAWRIGRYNLPKVLANLVALLKLMGPDRVTVHTVQYGQDTAPLRKHLQSIGVRRHIVQPLQVKDDYAKRYAGSLSAPSGQVTMAQPIAFMPRTAQVLEHYSCSFLDKPRMRYFNIDGIEMPCCFIKDVRVYTSADDLRQTLVRRQIPPACSGCRELR